MLDALRNAAKRGVDVRLVLPGIPDKKLVFRLSRSYYLPLLRAPLRSQRTPLRPRSGIPAYRRHPGAQTGT